VSVHSEPEFDPEEEPERPACPKCGSLDIRRSRGNSLWAYFLALFGRSPFRCRSCRVKFYRHASRPEDA